MARIKRVYLGEQPAPQPQLSFPYPPLAPGAVGWPGLPADVPQPLYQQTPPYGVFAPPTSQTGTTQIVYYPVPTAPLAAPAEGRGAGFVLRGCLALAAIALLASVLLLLRLPTLTLPASLAQKPADVLLNTVPRLAASRANAPMSSAVQPAADRTFRYDNPPSITRDQYIAIWCAVDSPACHEAGTMYDALVNPGDGLTPIDPAIEAGQAAHETVLGTAGVGIAPIKNLHGVQCHAGDNRVADSSVPWGNGCAAIYGSYTDSVKTWVRLLNREYFPEGRMTPAAVVAKYAPAGADGNNPPAYIAVMQSCILQFRAGRDRCDHGLPFDQAQALGAVRPAATAAPESIAPSAGQQPRMMTGPRATLTATSWVWDGTNERIALHIENRSEQPLVLDGDTLRVRSSTGTTFSLPTDQQPLSLAVGQAVDAEFVLGTGPDQAVTITLTFPDSILTLQLDAPRNRV